MIALDPYQRPRNYWLPVTNNLHLQSCSENEPVLTAGISIHCMVAADLTSPLVTRSDADLIQARLQLKLMVGNNAPRG